MDTKFKPKDLKDLKFGRLTAISISNKITKKGEYYWNCLCECGKHCIKRTSTLTTKKQGIKSCGCYFDEINKKIGKESKSWKGYKDISGTYYRRIIEGALKREIEFNLLIEDIWEIYIKQNKKCVYTNIDLKFDKPGYHNRYSGNLSIDRIDSKVGYTKDNIQIVLKEVNLMKNTLSHEEFIKICKLVTATNEGFAAGGGIR